MSDVYLFKKSIRDLLRVKRLGIILLLIAIPAVIAAIQRSLAASFDAQDTLNSLTSTIIYGFVLTILSIALGTDVVAREVDDKTIVYLLTRALPRWRILMAKFAAAILMTTLSAWIALLLLGMVVVGPARLGSSSISRDLAILPVGALAYSSVALLIATVLKRPLIAGLLFAFGWETWVPGMPGAFQKLALMTYLHVLAPHVAQPAADSADTISSPTAWATLAGVIAICLFLAISAFSTREYVPKEEAD